MPYLVRSATLQQFEEILTAAGHDPAPIIAASDLPPEAFREPSLFVSIGAVGKLYERAARETGMMDLGMRVGVARGLAGLGLLGALIRDCTTLGEAVRTMIDHQGYHNRQMPMRLARSGDGLELRFELFAESEVLFPQLHEMSAAITCAIVRMLAPDVTINYITLRHRPTVTPSTYRLHLPVVPDFGAECTAIGLPADSFEARVRSAVPQMKPLIQDALRSEIGSPGDDIVTTLEGNIAQMLRTGPVSLECAAASLGVATRTLQRLLAQEGVSFSEIVEKVREREALFLLGSTERPMSEIASLLGFPSQSAFSHWCRGRWLETPSLRRRRIRTETSTAP